MAYLTETDEHGVWLGVQPYIAPTRCVPVKGGWEGLTVEGILARFGESPDQCSASVAAHSVYLRATAPLPRAARKRARQDMALGQPPMLLAEEAPLSPDPHPDMPGVALATRPDSVLRAGQTLVYTLHRAEPVLLLGHLPQQAVAGPGLIAWNKPGGLPVHPTGPYNRISLTSWANASRAESEGEPASDGSLVLAHRIDRVTSGIVIMADKATVLPAVTAALQSPSQHSKLYLLRVAGDFSATARCLPAWLQEPALPPFDPCQGTTYAVDLARRGYIAQLGDLQPPLHLLSKQHSTLVKELPRPLVQQCRLWLSTLPDMVCAGAEQAAAAAAAAGWSLSPRAQQLLRCGAPVVLVQAPLLTIHKAVGINTAHPAGKPSSTLFAHVHYDADSDTSVLAALPLTGRTHQIRVHALFMGHPIANDPAYGGHAGFHSLDASDQRATAGGLAREAQAGVAAAARAHGGWDAPSPTPPADLAHRCGESQAARQVTPHIWLHAAEYGMPKASLPEQGRTCRQGVGGHLVIQDDWVYMRAALPSWASAASWGSSEGDWPLKPGVSREHTGP